MEFEGDPKVVYPKLHRYPHCVVVLTQLNEANAQKAEVIPFKAFMYRLLQHHLRFPRPNFFYHEVIFPNKKCRFFMDCDRKLAPGEDPIDEKAFVDDMHARVVDFVRKCSDIKTPPAYPTILRSTRPDRFSVHLLWNVVAANPKHLHAVASEIARHALFGVEIDLGPYALNSSPKSIRMPFCGKRRDRERYLAAHQLMPTTGQRTFTPEAFCSHLITFFSDTCDFWGPHLPPAPTELYTFPGLDESTYQGRRATVVDGGTSPVLDWMKIAVPLFTAAVTTDSHGRIIARSDVIFCESANRIHRSNGTFVNIAPNGSVVVRCADPACKSINCFPHTAGEIAVSETMVDLDWEIYERLIPM